MKPPVHKSSSGDFFPALDGIRALAVLSVVIYHTAYFNPASPIQNILFAFTKAGFMGVPVFFVLSGFLISYTIFKSQENFNISAYAIRRSAKILPPFLISLILFSLLALHWQEPKNIWLSAAAFLFTLPNFTNGWDEINPVYWSLMIEIHFYIIFPLLFFSLKRLSFKAELWCILIFSVVPTVLRFLTHINFDASNGTLFTSLQVFPRAMDNFVFGILFAHVCINKASYESLISKSKILSYVGVGVLALCYLLRVAVTLYFPMDHILAFELFRFLPALGTFLLLFCIFSNKNTLINRILTLAPLQYIGLISYEWFLFHYPPVQFLGHYIGQAGGSVSAYLCKTLLPFSVTFIFAACLYHFVSAPITSWAKLHIKSKS